MSNLTNVTGAKDIVEMYIYLDAASSNWLSLFILATFFIMTLILGKRFENDFTETLLVGSFLTTVLASIMMFANFISFTHLIYPLLILIGSILYYAFQTR